MNIQRLKNQWKYHHKKYLALACTIVALCCLAGSGAFTLFLLYGPSEVTGGLGTYFSIYDFALFAIAYVMILVGNLQGTTLAYQGLLMYVFMTFFSAVLAFFESGFLQFGVFWSGNVPAIILLLLVLLFDALIAVTGIMAYIRTAQFLRNGLASYTRLRNWCFLFAVFNTLLYGAEPAYLVVSGSGVSALLLVLEPLSQIFIGWAIFFTITRLKTES